MKKFRFRLKSVHRQREIIEDLRKREVGAAKQAVENAKDEKESLENRKAEGLLGREQLAAAGTTKAYQYAIFDNFIIGTKQQIGSKQNEIERLNEEVRRRMEIYLEAYKKKRIVDKLQDKAKTEWKKESEKDANNKAGDLFTVRFAHDQIKKADGEA